MTTTTQTAPAQKPLDRMLEAFPSAHQRTNGWWAHDDNPRFDFLETPEGDIRIHSHTGRTVDDILSMGKVQLSRGALYARPGQFSAVLHRDKLDLLTLAEYMRLDWRFLLAEGYSDDYRYTYSGGGQVQCVKLGGIFHPDGTESSKHQVRVSLNGKGRFYWDQNTPGLMLPSGLHHLDWARAAGYLLLGEGNSDFATCAFHGLPFVGIPGADQAKTLEVELLADIPAVYLIEEPDQVHKLKRSGQGFYKNMRTHLRENGYTGDIFTIRFMDTTGYKDPSDLHKAVYAGCKEHAEGPFRQEVHAAFLAAMNTAMERAIPEGNTDLFPLAAARDWSKISFEEFSLLVWKVSSEFLSPIQKMIVCYLFLYMKRVEPGELGWKIDAASMAPEVGLKGPKGKKQFLEHVSYLQQKVGILRKVHRARKEYMNGEEDDAEQIRYKGMDLFIEPPPNFFIPGSYCVVTADQHAPGGPRIAFAKCVNCGSEHLDRYEWQHCPDCNYDHFKPLYDTPPLSRDVAAADVDDEEELAAVVVEDSPEMVDSTLEASALAKNPEYPNLGYSGKVQPYDTLESDTDPHFGVFGNTEPPTADPDPDAIPLSFLLTPCRRCGRYDAVKRPDGVWVCPCTLPIMQREQLT